MNIIINKVVPGENEVSSSLQVNIALHDYEPNWCQIDIRGFLFSGDKTLLSVGEEFTNGSGLQSSLYKERSKCDVEIRNLGHRDHAVAALRFIIDERAFDYINNQRMLNENHDVILKFLIELRLIEHNLTLPSDDTVAVRDKNEALGRKNLFKICDFQQPLTWTIPSHDWENSFMEHLGFGKFMLFELDKPSNELSNFTSTIVDVPRFTERLEASKASLKKMQNYMKQDQWDQVVEQLRDVDLLESGMKQDIKKLLKETMNLPEDKSQVLTMALDNLYSFSSQFHHSVHKDKVNPAISINKEDADFSFMVMLAITQLLQRKLGILKRLNS